MPEPKVVKYETQDGFIFDVIIPEGAPVKHAKYGIKIGPPDLSGLKLSKEVERRLNNALYHRGLLTGIDVRRRRQDVIAAWQSVLGTDVSAIVDCYNTATEKVT